MNKWYKYFEEFETRRIKENKNMKWLIVIYVLMISIIATVLIVGTAVKEFTINWIIFVLLISFMPLCYIVHFMQTSFYYKQSKEEEIKSIISLVAYIIFSIIDAVFVLCAIKNWQLWMYILGCIIIVSSIYRITKNFISTNYPVKLMLMFDLVVMIGITIYMIYKIPDDYGKLQIIVTSIVAAVYGGLITLTGVAWTIKHGDEQRKEERERLLEERKEEEKQKAKPIFTCIFENDMSLKPTDVMCGVFTPSGCVEPEKQIAVIVNILNSDNSNFEITKFYFDAAWRKVDFNKYVLKNQKIKLFFITDKYACDWLSPYAYMQVKDMLGNIYYYKLKFKNSNTKLDRLNIVESIEEVTEEEVPLE